MAITLPRTGANIGTQKTSNPATTKTSSSTHNVGRISPDGEIISRPTLNRSNIPQQTTNRSVTVTDQNQREFGTAQEEMFKILTRASQQFASDVLFSVGLPPMFRVSGSLVKDNFPVLNPDMSKKLIYSMLRQDQISEYEKSNELDLSVSIPGIARFRVNVFRQKKCVGAAFRSIAETIPTFDQLGLPPVASSLIRDLCLNFSLLYIFDICISIIGFLKISKASLIATEVCVNPAALIIIPSKFFLEFCIIFTSSPSMLD